MWFKIKAYILFDDALVANCHHRGYTIFMYSQVKSVYFPHNENFVSAELILYLMTQQLQMVIIEDILSLCTPMLNQSISHIMKVSLLLYLYIETSNLHFQDQLKTRPLSSFSSFDNPRHLSSFSSFDNPRGRQIQKAPLRTKSMLAAFFVKHRSAKMKNVSVR